MPLYRRENDYLLKIVTESTATLETLLNTIKTVKGVQKQNNSYFIYCKREPIIYTLLLQH